MWSGDLYTLHMLVCPQTPETQRIPEFVIAFLYRTELCANYSRDVNLDC